MQTMEASLGFTESDFTSSVDKELVKSAHAMITSESTVIDWKHVVDEVNGMIVKIIDQHPGKRNEVLIALRAMVQFGKKNTVKDRGVLSSKDTSIPITFATVTNGASATAITPSRLLAVIGRSTTINNAYGMWACDSSKMDVKGAFTRLEADSKDTTSLMFLASRCECAQGIMFTGCLCKAVVSAAVYTVHMTINIEKEDRRDRVVGAAKQSKVSEADVRGGAKWIIQSVLKNVPDKRLEGNKVMNANTNSGVMDQVVECWLKHKTNRTYLAEFLKAMKAKGTAPPSPSRPGVQPADDDDDYN